MREFEWVDDSGISSIEVCKHMGFCDGNSDIQDLKKAVWYIEREIARLGGINE